MTENKKIEILRLIGFDKTEAKKRLESGTAFYSAEDFEENYMNYLEEWGMLQYEDEEEKIEVNKTIEKYRKMVEEGITAPDWVIYEYEDKKYYILIAC